MGVDISGNDQLASELERRLGAVRMQQIVDKALIAGAKKFVQEMKQEFQGFKDTGATINEITISDPMTISGVRTIKIYWKGPDDRYRIIHLNEWGTVKNPNPKGKGAIARTMKNAANAYREVIKQELRRGI